MPTPTNTRFAVAVHVLAYLAGAGEGRAVSSDELAASANVNPVHIRKVMGPLREAGLVASRSGARGGWELERSGSDIALVEVWDVLQGDDAVLGLHGPSPDCPVGVQVQASLVDLDRDVAQVVRRRLSETSVADVIGNLVSDATTGRPARAAPTR